MTTVLESINKKIEELGVGQVYEGIFGQNRPNGFDAEEDYSIVELSDPREYKEFFRLDDLGIAKSIKSSVLEVKDSECKIYYILDSALISVTFNCKYQPIEIIKELPLALISYLRVLSVKKASIELNIYEDKIHIIFEDTLPKTTKTNDDTLIGAVVIDPISFEDTIPKKRQKKEKPIAKKYTLEILLKDLDELDKSVLNFAEFLDTEPLIFTDPFDLPITLKEYNTQFNSYTKILSSSGEFKYAVIHYNENLIIRVIECPILISNNFIEETINSYTKEDMGEQAYQDFIDDCNYRAELVDEFLLNEESNND